MAGSDDSIDQTKYPMNLKLVTKRKYRWDICIFLVQHYNKPRSSPSVYFHTSGQFRLFRGGLDRRPMHQKHRWVSWDHLGKFPQMDSVVAAFQAIGLKDMMGMKQDWNELVIRQFYATLEINEEMEELTWMIGTGRLQASFSDLAAVCRLDYQAMMQGINAVDDLEYLGPKERQILYYDTTENGGGGGLRRIPKVLWKLLSRTIVSNDEDLDETDLPCYVDEMIMDHKRWDPDNPQIYQPYIMALVRLRQHGFQGSMETTHDNYRIYNHDMQIFERNPSP